MWLPIIPTSRLGAVRWVVMGMLLFVTFAAVGANAGYQAETLDDATVADEPEVKGGVNAEIESIDPPRATTPVQTIRHYWVIAVQELLAAMFTAGLWLADRVGVFIYVNRSWLPPTAVSTWLGGVVLGTLGWAGYELKHTLSSMEVA